MEPGERERVCVAALNHFQPMRVFLGPILLIMDASPANVHDGIVMTVVLVLVIGLGLWGRRWWSLLIAAAAALLWLVVGIIGDGIGC